MKTILRSIAGIILIGSFILLLSFVLNSLQKPNALENIEKRLDEAEQQQQVLTEKEKELEKLATEKDWEEVDKDTNK